MKITEAVIQAAVFTATKLFKKKKNLKYHHRCGNKRKSVSLFFFYTYEANAFILMSTLNIIRPRPT